MNYFGLLIFNLRAAAAAAAGDHDRLDRIAERGGAGGRAVVRGDHLPGRWPASSGPGCS